MSIPVPAPDAIHLTCSVCKTEYVALGITADIAAAAANAGPTCCLPTPTAAVSEGGEGLPVAVGQTFEPIPFVRTRTALLALVVALFAAPFVAAVVMRT